MVHFLVPNSLRCAITTLAPHAAVTLVDRGGMPTLVAQRAAKLEITVESADPTESYRPLLVLFQQAAAGPAVKADPDGKINFRQYPTAGGTIVIDGTYLQNGRDVTTSSSSSCSAPPTARSV